jgi:hypothetical protein
MVVNELLLNKMSMLQSYLSDGQTQFVKYGEKRSSAGGVTRGIPHRSVVSPILFISYIDSGVIRCCQFHIYADDLQIYRSSDIAECYDKVNLDLEWIHEWATANGLRLKPIKSQVILIHRRKAVIPLAVLCIGTNAVKIVSKVNNL